MSSYRDVLPSEIDLGVGIAVVEDHVKELGRWLQSRFVVHLQGEVILYQCFGSGSVWISFNEVTRIRVAKKSSKIMENFDKNQSIS